MEEDLGSVSLPRIYCTAAQACQHLDSASVGRETGPKRSFRSAAQRGFADSGVGSTRPGVCGGREPPACPLKGRLRLSLLIRWFIFLAGSLV